MLMLIVVRGLVNWIFFLFDGLVLFGLEFSLMIKYLQHMYQIQICRLFLLHIFPNTIILPIFCFFFSPVTFLLWLWQVLLFVNMSINEYVYVLLYTLTCTLFMCVKVWYILVVVYHKTFIMTMSFYHWRFFW